MDPKTMAGRQRSKELWGSMENHAARFEVAIMLECVVNIVLASFFVGPASDIYYLYWHAWGYGIALTLVVPVTNLAAALASLVVYKDFFRQGWYLHPVWTLCLSLLWPCVWIWQTYAAFYVNATAHNGSIAGWAMFCIVPGVTYFLYMCIAARAIDVRNRAAKKRNNLVATQIKRKSVPAQPLVYAMPAPVEQHMCTCCGGCIGKRNGFGVDPSVYGYTAADNYTIYSAAGRTDVTMATDMETGIEEKHSVDVREHPMSPVPEKRG